MDLSLCTNIISNTFPLTVWLGPLSAPAARHQSNKYTQVTEGLLWEASSYQSWDISIAWPLLFLSGLTLSNGTTIAANKLANSMAEESSSVDIVKSLCVICIFHAGLRHKAGQRQSPVDLLGNVLDCVLAQSYAILHNRLPPFKSCTVLVKWCDSDQGKAATNHMLDMLRERLARLVDKNEENPTWICIIID